jgi:hypothetical protein
MVFVNPYAKKKPAAPVPSAVASTLKPKVVSEPQVITKTPVVAAPVQLAKASSSLSSSAVSFIKSAPHVHVHKPTRTPTSTPTPPTSKAVAPKAATALTLKLKPTSNKVVSLKSQLKKQIQDLKRAKQAKIHRQKQEQLDLERQRQRELLQARRIKELHLLNQERNAKEQERLEREQQRQQEKQKRMKEKLVLEQERLRQKELKRILQQQQQQQQQLILQQQQQQQRQLEMQRQFQMQQHYRQLQAMGHMAPFSNLPGTATATATPPFQQMPWNYNSMPQVTPSPSVLKARMIPMTGNVGLVGAGESSSSHGQAKSQSLSHSKSNHQLDSKQQETMVVGLGNINNPSSPLSNKETDSVTNLESKFDASVATSANSAFDFVVPSESKPLSSSGQPPPPVESQWSPSPPALMVSTVSTLLKTDEGVPPIHSASPPVQAATLAVPDNLAPFPASARSNSSATVVDPASKLYVPLPSSMPSIQMTASPTTTLQLQLQAPQGPPEPERVPSASVAADSCSQQPSATTTTTATLDTATAPNFNLNLNLDESSAVNLKNFSQSTAANSQSQPKTMGPSPVVVGTWNPSSHLQEMRPWMPAVPQGMWQQPMAPTTPWEAPSMNGEQSSSIMYPHQHLMSPYYNMMAAAASPNNNPMAMSMMMMPMMQGNNNHGRYSAWNHNHNPSIMMSQQLPMTSWPQQAQSKPIRSNKPRAAPKKPQFEAPERLVAALEPPSPFAHTHYLLLLSSETNLYIVRKQDENFGVNIKCEKRSVLVDPEWWLQARSSKNTSDNHPSTSKPKTTSSPMVGTIKEDSKTPPNAPDATKPATEIVEEKASENGTGVVDEKKRVETSPTEENPANSPQKKTVGEEYKTPAANSSRLTATTEVKKPVGSSLTNTVIKEKNQENSSQRSAAVVEQNKPLDFMVDNNVAKEKTQANPTLSTDDVQEKSTADKASGVEEDSKATSESFKENDPTHVTVGSNDNSSALERAKETGSVSQPTMKRRRRLRVNLGVMMVDDPSKQNSRREGTTSRLLLKPGDIILSINGQQVAGRTFQEACGLFSACKAEDDQLEIRASLVVARRKEVQVISKPQVVPKPVQVKKDIPKTATVTTTLRDLSNLELAVLAKCVLDAGENPQRLLGQSTLEDHFRQATSVFHLTTATASVISPRSFETIKDKWGQITRKIERTIVEQAMEFWRSQWGLEIESVRKLGMPFITDAHRSAMRNLPRPRKGCRCGREDHEFVHDPKCFLYSDLRRLAPDHATQVGTTKQSLAVSKFKNLNAVETAFKERVVKLKTEKDSEEAEARFVAHMENIQVNKCKKALFAPTLSAMILSTVFKLQDEFPEPEDDEESLQITKEMDIDSDDNSESDEEDDVPLVALGKRKTASTSQQETKKQKTDAPRLSYTFLARLLSHISTTWGHVYREPSHEDYAW